MPQSSTQSRRPSSLSKMLLPEQESAAHWVVTHPQAALFFEQRTGKTLICLRAIELIAPKSVLIICPMSGKNTAWVDQIAKFFPNRPISRSEADFAFLHNYHGFVILHYEEVEANIKWLLKHPWSMIIYDESQRLKARNTKASRYAKKLSKCKGRRVILSGTPVEKQPQDLWAQFRFVAPEVFGSWRRNKKGKLKFDVRWAEFDEEYLQPYGYMGYKRRFIREKMGRFLRKIDPYILRMKRSDLGIVDPVIEEVPVYMLGDQRELYDTLESDFIASMGPVIVSADLEVTKLVKLQQITGGFVRDSDEQWHKVGEAKLRKFRWLLRRVKPPILVGCQFIEELRMIKDELIRRGFKTQPFYGKVKKPQRDKILRDFKARKLDAVVVQARTGGSMVDFSAATCGIIYSTTHSSIDYDQLVSRLSHIERKDRPTIFHLYIPDTVDEDKLTAINSKISLISAMMKRLRGTKWQRQRRNPTTSRRSLRRAREGRRTA